MKRTAIRLASISAVAALIATMAPLSAHAATAPAWDSTSAAKVYLVNQTTSVQFADNTQLDWNQGSGVILSAVPVPTQVSDFSTLAFPAPTTDEIDYQAFIAPAGSERTRSAWKSWGDPNSLDGSGALIPAVYPGYLGGGNPSQVKSGGTFSMGIAYMKNNDQLVGQAFYTTINVDAGTGTWKFATPAAVVVTTDVTTTTTLAADVTLAVAGTPVTLTATVASTPAATGNVQFLDGATVIGTTGVAPGAETVTKSVTANVAGVHTYSAKFVESTVGTSKFLASSSSNAVVTFTTPPAPAVPNAPSLNSLNSATANGATAAYDATTHKATLTVPASVNGATVNTFVYSAPIFLGAVTVAGGSISFDVSVLPAGVHTMVIVDTTSGAVLGWATFTKSDAASQPTFSKTINADVANTASVPADGEFSLTNLSGDSVNLTNPALVNGKSVVSGQLGDFKVTDMRVVTKAGWTLKTDVVTFAHGTDTIAVSALGIAPVVVSQVGAKAPDLGAAQVSGSAVYPWNFASLGSGFYSGVSTYNADLVFTAPVNSPAGTYTSTLTLTLISG
jgi:Bacterial Ig-like domain (group 3)